MKKLLFILSFFVAFQLSAQEGDNSYVMYQIITLKPLQGQGQDLRAGLKGHNDKYHQEGSQQVNVWAINSGPRTGSLSWVKGPLTWTDFDTPIAGDGYAIDLGHVAVEESESSMLTSPLTSCISQSISNSVPIRWKPAT